MHFLISHPACIDIGFFSLSNVFVFASCTRNPLRNRVIVLLSAKAGLRAHEIAA